MSHVSWGGPWSRRDSIGIAIGRDGICAVFPSSSAGRAPNENVWSRTLAPLEPGASRWPALHDALLELKTRVTTTQRCVRLALLPELAQLRRISLPTMQLHEARSVLTRDAGRYFFAAREAHIVSVERSSAKRDESRHLLAAATPAHVLSAIHAELREEGWRVSATIPAYVAWARAALVLHGKRPDGDVVIEHCGVRHHLRLARGNVVGVGRTAICMTGGSSTDSSSTERASCAPAFVIREGDAAATAARYAPANHALDLVPEEKYRALAGRVRRTTMTFAAAGLALFALTATLELWGAKRELAAVLSARASLRARVSIAVAARERLNGMNERLVRIEAVERSAPRWSQIVSRIAITLPEDAHLVAIRGRADSLMLEGYAAQAVGVFDAMRRTSGVQGMRASAPITRELDAMQHPVERFALALRFAPETDSGRVRR
ncbi:MAG: hypothetical protein Q8K82_07075 [Gemmatimonadaceae bacterium]|nr:hypothetical protein [Gemmatimonadaceae bacterium]